MTTLSNDAKNRLNVALASPLAGKEVADRIDNPLLDFPLASAQILVGDVNGNAQGVAPTGDATISNTGAITSTPASANALRSVTSPIGYKTGAGGAVTQATNRTTGVTVNTLSGTITTNNASLAAEVAAVFVVTNSKVEIGDVVLVTQQSGSNGGNTDVAVVVTAAGSFSIKVANNNASGGTAETGAILINFAIVKGVSA